LIILIIALPIGGNPFTPAVTCNPFQAAKPPPPTINQLRSQNNFTSANENNLINQSSNHPMSQCGAPSSPSSSHNPFAM